MKFKPIGIVNAKHLYKFVKPSNYSDKNYNCVEVRNSRDDKPVIIMQSKKTTPLMWKVCYGFSQVYFRSFKEAIDFCNSRGMKIIKEQE